MNHIVIADDHPLYLEALKNGLINHLQECNIIQAQDYLTLFDELHGNVHNIDVLLMDLFMPGSSGFTGLAFLRAQFPELPIVVISAFDDLSIRSECLSQGVAFISKSASPTDIFSLVSQILDGSYRYPKLNQNHLRQSTSADRVSTLTPSQFKVLHLITAGHTNKIIANQLHISEKTVKTHISAIFEKLNVKNRTQAALLLTDGA